MIQRLYVHNFRTLVNFSIEFERMNLLLGPNGSGKSTVLDVLDRLRRFLSEENPKVESIFSEEDCTRWDKGGKRIQKFEVTLADGFGKTWEYQLRIEHKRKKSKSLVGRETLLHDGKPLYWFDVESGGQARLYRDDYSEGPEYLFDWSRSGVGSIHGKPFNSRLTAFRERFRSLFVVKMHLPDISSEAPGEDDVLRQDLKNFASWYRHVSQERQGRVFELISVLREILPGFDSMNLQTAGESKLLNAVFSDEEGDPISYRFAELSDGQKVLIILYALLYCVPKKDVILCIDEPENYLALPEVRHWLDALEREVAEERKQAILISHHPRLINLLAGNAGQWFSRESAGLPTRVKPIAPIEEDGLPADKLLEMGWLVDD
jgi:predicted ATPase